MSTVIAPHEVSTKFSLYWFFMDSYRMTKRSVLHILRSFDQVMSLVMFPIMFMVLFRYVYEGAIDPPGDITYVNYLFPGILVQTLAFGANYTTLNIAVDMKEGIVDRFRSLPMSNAALIVGHVNADLFRNVISGIIMTIVAVIVGFRPEATPTEWLGVIGIAIIFTLAISWMSAILGMLVNSIEAAQWVGFVVIFPLTFASSAFVPTDNMPSALKAFAENQPLTHVIDAIRSLLVGTDMGDAALLSVIWCAAIIAVSIPTTAFLFRRKAQK